MLRVLAFAVSRFQYHRAQVGPAGALCLFSFSLARYLAPTTVEALHALNSTLQTIGLGLGFRV